MHLPFLTAQGRGDGELLLFMKPSLSGTLSGLAPRGSMDGSVTRLGYCLLNACSTHTTVPRIYWLVSHLRAVPTQGRVRAADACTGALESIGARARPALAAQEESVAHSVWRFNFMLPHELLIFVLFVWAEAGMS